VTRGRMGDHRSGDAELDSARAFARLLVGVPPGLEVDWGVVLRLARQHKVSPFVFWRLRDLGSEGADQTRPTGGWNDVPRGVQEGLRADFYVEAAQQVALASELRRILSALGDVGVPVVLLKGAALGRTVYPSPVLRSMGDVDLLVPVECQRAVHSSLEELGYRWQSAERPGYRPRRYVECFGKTWDYCGPVDSEVRYKLEVHHKLVGGAWVRGASRMTEVAAGVMERAVPMGDGMAARQLCPEDTLLHVCVHLAINNAFTGNVVRNLLDVALLVDSGVVDWLEVQERAWSWRVATACYAALDAAARLLDAPIPDRVLGALQPGAGRRLVLDWILDERALVENPWRFVGLRRFLLQFLLVDRLSDALSLLRHTFFPDRSWLMLRYELESCPRWRVWLQQVWHPLRVVLRGEV
jgi:hypothetical protein